MGGWVCGWAGDGGWRLNSGWRNGWMDELGITGQVHK